MSMFKTLAPLAMRSAKSMVMLTLSDAGEGKLRVIVNEKQADKGDHTPLSLCITGTPEELDAELPLAIAEGAALPAKSITEQVSEQRTAAESDDDTPAKKKPAAKPAKKSTPKKPAAKKAPAKKPAPKKPAAKTAGKVMTPKQAAAKTLGRDVGAGAMKTPVITPLIHPAAEKALAKKPAAPKPDMAAQKAEKREKCLADLRAAIAVHGPALTRKQFAAMATTGRSFETCVGTWEQFLTLANVHTGAAQPAGTVMSGTEVTLGETSAPIGDTLPAADETFDPVAAFDVAATRNNAEIAAPPLTPAPPLVLEVQGEDHGTAPTRHAVDLF